MERPNTNSKFAPNPDNIQTLTRRYNFIENDEARQLLHDALLKNNGIQGEALERVDRILHTISQMRAPQLNERVEREQLVEQRPRARGAAAVAHYVPTEESIRQVMQQMNVNRDWATHNLADALIQFRGDQQAALQDVLQMLGGYKMSRKSKVKMSRKSKVKMSRKSKVKMSRKSKVKMSRKSKTKMSRKSKTKMSRKSKTKMSRKSKTKMSRKK
jgi:hypothetical protein